MNRKIVYAAILSLLPPFAALAADGPDRWDVTGVAGNDTLNLRMQPSASADVLARIPHNAKGLRNLGCRGEPSLDAFQRMSAAERQAAVGRRWCQVAYRGRKGWVASRFLKESAE
jgi:hypothetical protein